VSIEAAWADEAEPARRTGGADPKTAWTEAAVIVLTTRLAFFAIAYAATWFLADTVGQSTQGFFDTWMRWDSRHFIQAAEFGYTDPRTDPHITAFFPLFPLLMGGFGLIGFPYVGAGMLISTGASIVAAAYLYRLAEEELGEGTGRSAVLFLTLFPTGVFLAAPYSEALFLAGAVPAFYYARRKQWLLVGPGAAIAVASRFAGVFLLFGLACEFLRQRDLSARRIRQGAVALAAGVVPLILYGAYLAQIKGSAFYFFTDQKEGWQRDFTNPITSFWTTWNTWHGESHPTNFIFAWRVEILAAAVGVAFVAWAIVKREWGYAGFMGALVGAMLTSFIYMSIPRILLSMFPIMLFMAEAARDRPWLRDVLLTSMAPLAALGVIVYTQGSWFY
jgi:Mannosyltransferase (PIG-V)